MKLYTSKVAPNPRRVHIFLAEKGVEIESVEIDLGESQNLDPDFVARNPLGRVPVLELDDGAYLAESIAICRYLRDKAMVEMWNRRMEFEIMAQISGCFRHTHRYWEGRIPQIPEYGELCRKTVLERMAWLDGELADREFIAGDRFTVADITAFTAISLGRIPKIRIAEELTNLQRWFDAVRARPSVG